MNSVGAATKSAAAPRVTIVIPAWNEARSLPECVAVLRETFRERASEVVIVNDGSRDDTARLAREIASRHEGWIRVIDHEVNQGLGAALRTGLAAATGEYVTCCPADFAMTERDWEPFDRALGEADVIVGCRSERAGYNPLMLFNAWVYPYLVKVMFGLRLRDVNWISVYRTELLRVCPITQSGIPMLAEILVRLRDVGASFVEVPCTMQPRRFGTPSAARLPVMWRTLVGLVRLWASYERPRPAPRI